jgi:hypothetical protein
MAILTHPRSFGISCMKPSRVEASPATQATYDQPIGSSARAGTHQVGEDDTKRGSGASSAPPLQSCSE